MKEIAVLKSKEIQDQLNNLAREINDLYASAGFKAGKTTELARDAVKEVLLCGQRLKSAKSKLPHKQWLPWLRNNCPTITKRTATNWMRLANEKHVSLLEGCTGLRQAYIACGILPPSEPKEAKPAGPATVEDLIRFAGIASRITPESFSGMVLEQGQRETLRERLKPAHEAYLALGDAA